MIVLDKYGTKAYMRTCKRCHKIYWTYAKKGRYCDKCKKVWGKKKQFKIQNEVLLCMQNK